MRTCTSVEIEFQELPRVEAQLSELFSQYLEKTGQPLLINGDDYRYIIEQQWKSHDDQKENEKLQRVPRQDN